MFYSGTLLAPPALRGPLRTSELAQCYRNDLLEQCPNILKEFGARELPSNWSVWADAPQAQRRHSY